MLLCKLLAILVLASATYSLQNDDLYTVPKPFVEVVNPRKFRISIPHAPGITSVAFHVNINKDVARQGGRRSNGSVRLGPDMRWTFEATDAHLTMGDRIFYVLDIVRNKLRYRTPQEEYFLINRVPAHSLETEDGALSSWSPGQIGHTGSGMQETTTTKIENSSDLERILVQYSQHLITLHSELEKLRQTNQQLEALVTELPNAKKLTLSGLIPGDDALLTVTFIIHEKLDLDPQIASAQRNADGTIDFYLKSLDDKLKIIEAAKDKLKYSKIVIH